MRRLVFCFALRTFLLTVSVDMLYSPFTMETIESAAQLAGFQAEVIRLENKLAELDIQREETRQQLTHVRQIVANLHALSGHAALDNVGVLGFTDACRVVARDSHPNWLSASDIRDKLSAGGYDLQPYSNPLASIYTILRRLNDAGEIEKKQEGFQTFYRWIKRYPRHPLRRLAMRRAFLGKAAVPAPKPTAATAQEAPIPSSLRDK